MRLEPILLLLSAQLGHAYLYVQGMNGSISVCGLFTSIGSYSNSKDSSASFGPIVPATGVRGLLIRPTNDVHGCSIVSRLPGFIALVLRGKCSFTEKIRKMQSS